jgi:hypothetical protein
MSFFLIASCQTPIESAGSDHRIVTEKWYELSKYAESQLKNHDVTITAKLAINKLGEYKLSDIRLNTKETPFNIDLLAPNFNSKYICSPMCVQLVEYTNSSDVSGYTLLTSYFDQHEYQLYKFYGEIMLLNNQIKQLELINPNLFSDYLNVISKQEKSFNIPSKFIEYLRTSLSPQSFLKYLDSPIDPMISEVSFQEKETADWKNETNEEAPWLASQRVIKNNSTGQSTLSNNNITPDSLWKLQNLTEKDEYLTPNSLWLTKTLTEDEKINIASIKVTNSQFNVKSGNVWEDIRYIKIKKNDTVCSYAESMFGQVVQIQENIIKVLVIGQAKKSTDNIISNVPKGFLFKLEQNINFAPLYGYKDFQRSNIALCTFN